MEKTVQFFYERLIRNFPYEYGRMPTQADRKFMRQVAERAYEISQMMERIKARRDAK